MMPGERLPAPTGRPPGRSPLARRLAGEAQTEVAMSANGWRGWLVGWALLVTPAAGVVQMGRPDPVKNPDSPVLLDLPGAGTDPARIDYAKLPQLRPAHGVVCPTDPALK